MTVVVDASLAVKWVVREEHTGEALSLLDLWYRRGEQVFAPPIFRAEVTNVLHQKVRRGPLSRASAVSALELVLSLVAISEPDGLYARALNLASGLGLAAAYDALYLALAEYEGCELWTADQRLAQQATPRLPLVRWVGEGRSKSG